MVGGAFTFRKQTVIASLRGGSHIGNDIPFYDEFELGGFMSLSGLRFNHLRGQNLGLGRIITYHRVGHSFIGDLYLGVSLEAGNVWDGSFRTDDFQLAGSIFVGYDTILGPLYLGFGHAGQGRNADTSASAEHSDTRDQACAAQHAIRFSKDGKSA